MDIKEVLEQHKLWLQDSTTGSRANLRDAYLCDADLSRADLSRAYLCGANLRDAHLRDAHLRDANLSCANLRGADLRGANLSCANLSCADLRDADLRGAELSRATGNNRELKTLQCGTYTVTYTADTMQIGCKRFSIAEWFSFDDDAIDDMDPGDSLVWWREWKPLLKEIVCG